MAKWVELPGSKALVDLENVWFIGMTNLNEFHAFPKTPTQALPKFDGADRDFLAKQLGIEPTPAVEIAKPA